MGIVYMAGMPTAKIEKASAIERFFVLRVWVYDSPALLLG